MTRRSRLSVLVWGLWCLIQAPWATGADGTGLLSAEVQQPGLPPEPEAIIAAVAAQPGERVQFVERRGNSLLAEPLRLEGYLCMTDDDALIRVVQSPFHERARLDGESATLERDGRVRQIDLGRGRRGTYLRALYALLHGDEATLRGWFEFSTDGSRADWRFTLTPTQAGLDNLMEEIVLKGAGERVTSIRMSRKDGAWQEMQLVGPGV